MNLKTEKRLSQGPDPSFICDMEPAHTSKQARETKSFRLDKSNALMFVFFFFFFPKTKATRSCSCFFPTLSPTISRLLHQELSIRTLQLITKPFRLALSLS